MKQVKCTDLHMKVESQIRTPFYWADIKKPKLMQFRLVVDSEHSFMETVLLNEWSHNISMNDVGKMTMLSWNLNDSTLTKHIQVEKYLDPKTKILFLTFNEETQGELDQSI